MFDSSKDEGEKIVQKMKEKKFGKINLNILNCEIFSDVMVHQSWFLLDIGIYAHANQIISNIKNDVNMKLSREAHCPT